MKMTYIVFLLALATAQVHADNSTVDAAIGGGIGGAIGAAVGNEVGGKEGAMIGGAIGSAAGVAVNVDDDGHEHSSTHIRVDDGHHHSKFCPPGQAKKGNC